MDTMREKKMQVTVLYFAYLREERGLTQEIVSCPEILTVKELFYQVFQREATGIRFSVNQEFVASEQEIEEGDEIAFLPPVGGG